MSATEEKEGVVVITGTGIEMAVVVADKEGIGDKKSYEPRAMSREPNNIIVLNRYKRRAQSSKLIAQSLKNVTA